ncbi:ATP-binding protein [Sphaerimonospora thailandensis]|uniref:Histidine kinase/HSP90-like ATPase domain-containing protein n=1 Tax=Sphaerimonospora thailandensis TaxID=795644 RepID=A0A8J3RC80_9ACTN|nr:ATP-binding protein [Sphaerimonospora thailandensis]GIH73451.1 hypothetical protein Mth01_57040 [Sphaerimonospora thailandensis]
MTTNLAEAAPMNSQSICASPCLTWPLPPDTTCPAEARRLIRQTLASLGLPRELIDDAALAVSELAANVVTHVLKVLDDLPTPQLRQPAIGGPELWLYRRGWEVSSQIVCMIFDGTREWKADCTAETHAPRDDLDEHGRGLEIVQAVSAEWGCHVTRSHIGPPVEGKAVWFALNLPATSAIARQPRPRPTAAQAAFALGDQLVRRGITRVTRCDGHSESVLSVRQDLTVWCRNDTFSWYTDCAVTRKSFADLCDTVEQVVRAHEELALGNAIGAARRRP